MAALFIKALLLTASFSIMLSYDKRYASSLISVSSKYTIFQSLKQHENGTFFNGGQNRAVFVKIDLVM